MLDRRPVTRQSPAGNATAGGHHPPAVADQYTDVDGYQLVLSVGPNGTRCVPTRTDEDLAEWVRPGLGFAGAELVDVAASMFDRPLYKAGQIHGGAANRGREFYVSVSPGTVAVRMRDHDRVERTVGLARKSIHVHAAVSILGAESVLGPHGVGTSAQVFSELQLDDDGAPRRQFVRSARTITEWSRKSRARMTRTMAELDYSPIFDLGRRTAMGTLTYPGDWQSVAPSGDAVKAHWRALVKRWARAWGGRPALVWKLEFQRRGAPHFHFFFAPEAGTALCSCDACLAVACSDRECDVADGPAHAHLDFKSWLSHAWAEVVGADNGHLGGDGRTERERHRLAGTGIDYREGGRMTDPKRLAIYFTKHAGAGGGKEYQHRVPLEWQTPGNGPGRFWGYSGLVVARREVVLGNAREYVQLRRTLRRLTESKGMTRDRRVPRGYVQMVTVDGETEWVPPGTEAGRMVEGAQPVRRRRRKVTRRASYLGRGGMAGGFVCVNDGPAVASALSRLLSGPLDAADTCGSRLLRALTPVVPSDPLDGPDE
ncbi:MAG: hypothetical protein JWM84_3149 [Nocardioides sp.]|nr:hypothetical protein [Nocardioides sp.]